MSQKKKKIIKGILFAIILTALGIYNGIDTSEIENFETPIISSDDIKSPIYEIKREEQETEKYEIDKQESDNLEVHYINVGQGDATLITCDGKAMLIDAGDNSKGTTVQYYLEKQGIEKLDYVICTHSDADHIGGMDVIVTKFDIDNILMIKDTEKDTKTYNELLDAIKYRRYDTITPKIGDSYQLGSASFEIIGPKKDFEETNNDSISIILEHGDNKFLFAGDAELEAEEAMIESGINLDVDVYKVSHHGSKSSSSRKFLEKMTPDKAVISVGENDYGHPHNKTIESLEEYNVDIYTTQNGAVVLSSDKEKLYIKK